MKKALLFPIIFAGLLSGCTAVGSVQISDKELRRKTAAVLKTKASKVKISKRRRAIDIDTMRYNAKANGRRYRCYFQSDYKGKITDLHCKKRKSKRKSKNKRKRKKR